MRKKKSKRSIWFFDDPLACDKLKREAIEWLSPPTPFRQFSMAKGRAGGVDCIGLWQALHEAAGVTARSHFNFQRIASDYSSASSLVRMLRYVRGKVEEDPQSAELAELYAELLPATKLSETMAGDVLMMRDQGQFHVAIMIEPPHFVNALPWKGVTEGNIKDFTYTQYLIALFRAKAHS